MTAITIRLQGCRKAFADGTVAVHDLNLTVEGGETLAILGPSGCGKTTTLRLIAGLERPDVGQVFFGSDDVTRLPIERRDVGMVFQNYALFPNLDVAGNIVYGLKIRGMAPLARNKRCEELLELVGLQQHGKRSIHELSGGQRQRVALARALAPRPKVLLLDEPLAALDAQLRERLRSELNELLRGLGITSVFVTHDQGEAMALGDRILVMEHGRVAQLASPRQIYQQPANAFVAGFCRQPQCICRHLANGPWPESLRRRVAVAGRRRAQHGVLPPRTPAGDGERRALARPSIGAVFPGRPKSPVGGRGRPATAAGGQQRQPPVRRRRADCPGDCAAHVVHPECVRVCL